MSRVCSLFSGSKGNSTLVSCGNTSVLIDAGVSARRLCERLSEYDVPFENIDAVFVTHEHSDHIAGLSVLMRRHSVPVFATEGTLRGLIAAQPSLSGADLRVIGEGIEVGSLRISPFTTPHDANESCGYCVFTSDKRKITVCTDLGYLSDGVKRSVAGSDLVLLESNHDLEMLKNGPYNAALKSRVMGMYGHLSNDACAALLPELVNSGTTRILLGHLSEENNTLPIALHTSSRVLEAAGCRVGRDCILAAASRCGIGKMYIL